MEVGRSRRSYERRPDTQSEGKTLFRLTSNFTSEWTWWWKEYI